MPGHINARIVGKFSALSILAASACFASNAQAEEISPTGKGITGGALLGAELVMALEAAFGVQDTWAYVGGGVAGAAAGGVGGYFIEQGSDAKPSYYMLAGGMALIIGGSSIILYWRPHHPTLTLAVVLIAILVYDALEYPELAYPAILSALYSAGLYVGANRRALVYPCLAAVAAALSPNPLSSGADAVAGSAPAAAFSVSTPAGVLATPATSPSAGSTSASTQEARAQHTCAARFRRRDARRVFASSTPHGPCRSPSRSVPRARARAGSRSASRLRRPSASTSAACSTSWAFAQSRTSAFTFGSRLSGGGTAGSPVPYWFW